MIVLKNDTRYGNILNIVLSLMWAALKKIMEGIPVLQIRLMPLREQMGGM